MESIHEVFSSQKKLKLQIKGQEANSKEKQDKTYIT